MERINAYTLCELSAMCGRPIERLRYAVRRAGIEPALRAGTVKLFDLESASRIVAECSRIRPYHHRRQARSDNARD